MKRRLPFFLLMLMIAHSARASDKNFKVLSPDQHILAEVVVGETIAYRVSVDGRPVTTFNHLSMTLGDGRVLGVDGSLRKSTISKVDKEVRPLYGMASVYHDDYTELLLVFKTGFSVTLRVYDNGVAYRFSTVMTGNIFIKDEQVEYQFDADVMASMMRVGNFLTSYEEHYTDDHISYLDSAKMAALPLLVESQGIRIGITESDLLDYPSLYLTYSGNNGLNGVLPKFVSRDSIGGCCPRFEKIPYERADYLASTHGTRSFPWRLMIVARRDKDLLYNNLVYLLASENKIGDASWIKPGKVAWDWWSANNLLGVPFKTGFNTDTYKYFIDFAAANHIEYINMDEGWSDQFDLLKLNNGNVKIGTNDASGLDMPLLFEYAKKKNVGIILWCVWHTLERQMTQALDQFEKWGVKGLKVDFMDRDDQSVVNFYEKLAIETAKRKMIINFHGAFKPTGLERAYPNVINREAVQGLEYNKFSNKCTPEHATHIPFIRMLAGPMDYTPGGLYNSNETDFRVVMERPMTQGTRCQQLAMYTIFYAPLEMMSDAPTAYEKEPDMLRYISSMPTVWDETVPLDGKMGDFAVIARKKGDDWYVGGLTDWDGRTVKLRFDFLDDKVYDAEIFSDGPNADRLGNDYTMARKKIRKGDELDIVMKKGGGFAVRLIPAK